MKIMWRGGIDHKGILLCRGDRMSENLSERADF